MNNQYVIMNNKGEYLTRKLNIHTSNWHKWEKDLQNAMRVTFPLSTGIINELYLSYRANEVTVLIPVQVEIKGGKELVLYDFELILNQQACPITQSDNWHHRQRASSMSKLNRMEL